MTVTHVSAELAVADVEAGAAWYALLLGRPADTRPMDGLAEWHFEGTGSVQVWQDPERAGRGLMTLTVDDVEALLAALTDGGAEVLGRGEATSLGVPFATVADPDGNAVTLVQSAA